MTAPLHSVILPVHNGENTLEDALQSIAEQDSVSIEVIAVNDHSTDRSAEILVDWSERLPLRILHPETGGNWMAATNLGMDHAEGVWIHFLHQDDRWEPGRLAALETAAEHHPEIGFFCHHSMFLDSEGRKIGTWSLPTFGTSTVDASTFISRYATQNFLAIPSVMFRRSLLKLVGRLREDLWFLADWDFWLRLIHEAGDVRILDESFAGFRLHEDSQTATRTTDGNDLRRQFAEIRNRVTALTGAHPCEAAARVNEDLTVTLANWSHGQPGVPWKTLRGFLRLGPVQSLRFLQDTRLRERVWPRLCLRMRKG
jgi:glycosyltransferase involved in cell wall biosynthesis